jgi:long-chain acyl-CoA synthetase
LQVRDFLAQWEDRPGAYVKQDEAESFTHSELNQLARTNAGKLAGWNLRGENVALLANNSADWIVSYWGLVFAGATVVPLSPGFTERELLTLMKLCDCRWIVCDQKNEKSARKLSQKIHFGQLTISNGDLNMATAAKSSVERTRPTPAPVLCVTSGSTGTAKAVMLSDENLDANTQSHIESLSLSSRDIVLITLPLHYSYAHTAQF